MNAAFRFVPAFLAASLLAAGAAVSAQAPVVTAAGVKAAYLINFARFIEWPEDATPNGRLAFCVSGDPAVAEELGRMAHGKRIQQRELAVLRPRWDGNLEGCHVLYLSRLGREDSRGLVTRLRAAPVFSISDDEDFARMGGTANFFFEDNRIRFAINPAAAQRSRLRINSQVLGLARIVKEEHGP